MRQIERRRIVRQQERKLSRVIDAEPKVLLCSPLFPESELVVLSTFAQRIQLVLQRVRSLKLQTELFAHIAVRKSVATWRLNPRKLLCAHFQKQTHARDIPAKGFLVSLEFSVSHILRLVGRSQMFFVAHLFAELLVVDRPPRRALDGLLGLTSGCVAVLFNTNAEFVYVNAVAELARRNSQNGQKRLATHGEQLFGAITFGRKLIYVVTRCARVAKMGKQSRNVSVPLQLLPLSDLLTKRQNIVDFPALQTVVAAFAAFVLDELDAVAIDQLSGLDSDVAAAFREVLVLCFLRWMRPPVTLSVLYSFSSSSLPSLLRVSQTGERLVAQRRR